MFPTPLIFLFFSASLLLSFAEAALPVTNRLSRPGDLRAIWLLQDSTITCPRNITHTSWNNPAEGTFVVRHDVIIQDNKQCISPSSEHAVTFHSRLDYDDNLQPVSGRAALPEQIVRQLLSKTLARKVLEAGDSAEEGYMMGYESRVRQCGGTASFPDGTIIFVFRPFNDKLNIEGVERLRRELKWMVIAPPRDGGLCVYSSDVNGRDDGSQDDVSGDNGAQSGGGGGAECFPSDAQLLTRTRGLVSIANVAVGEYVAGGGDSWTKVIGFSHRDQSIKSTMVQVWTNSGERVTASEGHFLYTIRGLTTAGNLKVGDFVRLADGTMSAVSMIKKVRRKGLFNVQTMSGDVVVDGMWASTYTTAVRKEVAHAALAPLRLVTRLVEWDFVISAVEGGGLRRFAATKHVS